MNTTINATSGVLTVAAAETNATLTVRAASTHTPSIIGSATVNVIPFTFGRTLGPWFGITGTTLQGVGVTIPAAHRGEPVVRIGERAFAGRQLTGTLVIPSSVHTIENGAFMDNQLTSVVIQEHGSGIHIGTDAFRNNSLTSVVFPNNLSISFGNNAFTNNNLTNVVISTRIFPDNNQGTNS